MASKEIALVCGLKVRVGYQDRLCVNSDSDETPAKWESRYVSQVLRHSCGKDKLNECLINDFLFIIVFWFLTKSSEMFIHMSRRVADVFVKSNLSLYTRHTPKRVRNLRGHLRVIAPGYNTVSLCRSVAQVASRWQLCVQFDFPKI